MYQESFNRYQDAGLYDDEVRQSRQDNKCSASVQIIYPGAFFAGRMRRQWEHSRGERADQRPGNLVVEQYPRCGFLWYIYVQLTGCHDT